MTDNVSRAVVDAFYAAYISRDAERIGAFLADDVIWHVGGPVDVMAVCGSWHGRAAVVERFKTQMPKVVLFKKLDIESLLVDGNTSAMFGRISSIHRASGRLISHRVAHLVQYRDHKVVHCYILNDTLDAAEQFVGHRIDLNADPDGGVGDLIAV